MAGTVHEASKTSSAEKQEGTVKLLPSCPAHVAF